MSNDSVNYIVDSKGNNYGKKKAHIDEKKIVSKAIVDNTNKNITLIDRKGNKYYFGFEILDKAVNSFWKKPRVKNKEDKLKRIAKWEYDCLKRDFENQKEKSKYKGGFPKWFNEVFLVDEAWKEIREAIE